MNDTTTTKIRELLLTAIHHEEASMGFVHRFRYSTNDLHLIAQAGFEEKILRYFMTLKPFDSTCSGRAFGAGIPVVITDVERDLCYRPNLEAARAAGFRSIKSAPIINARGEKTGVVTLHYAQAKTQWDMSRLDRFLPEFIDLLELEKHLSAQA